MPANFRGRNAATALAAILAIALALVWLRSPDDAVPPVPPGLSVETMPATEPDEPPAPAEAAGMRRARKRAHHRRKHADRAGGAGEDDSRDPARENRLAPRQDPPATAPAPSAGSGGRGASGTRAAGGTTAAPEFALG
jgi:hypothetical protein